MFVILANNVRPASGITIIVSSATHAHTADQPAITQTHVVAVQEALHAHAADQPAITQTHVVIAAEATHGHTVDNVTITQGVPIIVADADHSHAADQPAITQVHGITVQEATHSHAVDSPAISQIHVVTVAESLHGHTVDAPAITQTHVVTVAEATHAHAADQPALTQLFNIAAQDALHSHSSASPAITQTHIILVDSALHAHTVDAATLTGTFYSVPNVMSTIDSWTAFFLTQTITTDDLEPQEYLDVFGESLTLYSHGDPATSTAFVGLWDKAGEVGNNQAPGDGMVVHGRPGGDKFRDSVMIEMDVDVAVSELNDPPDVIVNDDTGEAVRVVRIVSSDPSMKTVLGVRVDAEYIKGRSGRQ